MDSLLQISGDFLWLSDQGFARGQLYTHWSQCCRISQSPGQVEGGGRGRERGGESKGTKERGRKF